MRDLSDRVRTLLDRPNMDKLFAHTLKYLLKMVVFDHSFSLKKDCMIYKTYVHIRVAHGRFERVNLQKKMPGSDTYFFENCIPLGIQKRPNEKIDVCPCKIY